MPDIAGFHTLVLLYEVVSSHGEIWRVERHAPDGLNASSRTIGDVPAPTMELRIGRFLDETLGKGVPLVRSLGLAQSNL